MNLFMKTNNISKTQLMVAFLLLAFIMISSSSQSQDYYSKNRIFIFGQLTSAINGAPIKKHEVTITSDTILEPNYHYEKTVYTDKFGNFYDTVLTVNIKGAYIISTLDYLNQIHDTTVYYRFNWSEENYLFADFILPVEPPTVIYQANFYYIHDPEGPNNNKYQFVDLTNSENILSWTWSFGDGTFSNEQNPVHVYNSPGVYKVKLMAEIQVKPMAKPFVSTQMKVLNVTATSYFHLGGHVFAGYFPIDQGAVYLYKLENNNVELIDTAVFNDTLGFYYFFQLIEGNYLIKADVSPSSNLFNKYMTTYYGDHLHWDEADTVFHHETNFEYDIHMIPNNQFMTGPGKIDGIITYGGGGNMKYVPAKNVSIFLYSMENDPVNMCHSDEQGIFIMNNLEISPYYILAEVTGKNSVPLMVPLNDSTIEKILFTINGNTVTGSIVYAGIEDHSVFKNISQAFPNPASDFVYFKVNLKEATGIECSIYDNNGREITNTAFSGNPGMNLIHMDIRSLPSGQFFAGIRSSGGTTIVRKFIK